MVKCIWQFPSRMYGNYFGNTDWLKACSLNLSGKVCTQSFYRCEVVNLVGGLLFVCVYTGGTHETSEVHYDRILHEICTASVLAYSLI